MAVAVHGGNLFRTIISGSVIMAFTIWVSNQMIGLHTKLAQGVGQVGEGITQVASLDQGGSPFTYVLVQLPNLSDMAGLIAVGVIYFGCVIYTAIWSRRQYKEWAEELGEEEV